ECFVGDHAAIVVPTLYGAVKTHQGRLSKNMVRDSPPKVTKRQRLLLPSDRPAVPLSHQPRRRPGMVFEESSTGMAQRFSQPFVLMMRRSKGEHVFGDGRVEAE